MPKSAIIKEIANNEISLEIAFNRLQLIASDIENHELSKWAKSELIGYSESSLLPEYRKCTGGYFRYSGINGGFQVTNSPLPLGFISDEHINEIKKINFFEGIAVLEQMANENSKGDPIRDLTFMAGEVYKNSNSGITCTSIQQVIPVQMYQGVLASIKMKLIDIFLMLEQEYGCLDALDIEVTNIKKSDIQRINKQINCEIYTDNSISLGNQNSISKSTFSSQFCNEEKKKEKWYSKITWKIIVPIIVGVAIAGICLWLKLS